MFFRCFHALVFLQNEPHNLKGLNSLLGGGLFCSWPQAKCQSCSANQRPADKPAYQDGLTDAAERSSLFTAVITCSGRQAVIG